MDGGFGRATGSAAFFGGDDLTPLLDAALATETGGVDAGAEADLAAAGLETVAFGASPPPVTLAVRAFAPATFAAANLDAFNLDDVTLDATILDDGDLAADALAAGSLEGWEGRVDLEDLAGERLSLSVERFAVRPNARINCSLRIECQPAIPLFRAS